MNDEKGGGPASVSSPAVVPELQQPRRREATRRGVVKVQLPRAPGEVAVIADEGGDLRMEVPTGQVRKRFARADEAVGFFRYEVVDDCLELGERVPDGGW